MLPRITHKLVGNKILYFVSGGEVRKFTGENIKGFCAPIRNTDFIHLLPGVRSVCFDLPEKGVWGDDFNTWDDVMEATNHLIKLPVIQKIVRIEFLKTARRLDQALIDLESASNELAKPRRRRILTKVPVKHKSLHTR